MKALAAKLPDMPLQTAMMARTALVSKAAKLVVSIPKKPRMPSQDAQHQGTVERDVDDRAQVFDQRRIDVVAAHRQLHQVEDFADQPPADDPEGDGSQNFQAHSYQGGGDEGLDRLHVHLGCYRSTNKRGPVQADAAIWSGQAA